MSRKRSIRIALPYHLRNLAQVDGAEVDVEVQGDTVTLKQALDALEDAYPVLRGTMRDHGTLKRRPFIRFFACEQDLSLLDPAATELPPQILSREDALFVIGAIAGGA